MILSNNEGNKVKKKKKIVEVIRTNEDKMIK